MVSAFGLARKYFSSYLYYHQKVRINGGLSVKRVAELCVTEFTGSGIHIINEEHEIKQRKWQGQIATFQKW